MICIVIQRELTHYRFPFYIELGKYCLLKVLFSKLYISGLQENVILAEKIFKQVKGIFPTSNPYFSFLRTTLEIIRSKPDIIIHEMSLSIINVYFVPILAKIFGIKLIWWSHGYNRTDKNGRHKLKRYIRIVLHRLADSSIVYSSKGKEFLTSNGINPDKVFIAWNSVDTQTLNSHVCPYMNKEDKTGVTFVFLGRLIEEKKPLFAAELFKKLSLMYPDSKFHFIGGGDKENQFREFFAPEIYKNVFIHGEITDPKAISEILMQCDILVNPGCMGLNIVHALAFGIPVISVIDGADDVFHGPEFEYIENTDAFIPVSRLNIDEFEECSIRYIQNEELLKKAKASARECYKKVSMANMLNGFIEAINKLTIY